MKCGPECKCMECENEGVEEMEDNYFDHDLFFNI
jgi:hypothetical protein